MSTTTRQPNLFDRTDAGPTDGYLAQDQATRMPHIARARLAAMLEEARNATSMPWDARAERVTAMLFHNMANWLPESERDRVRDEFAAELARLRG